MTINQMSEDCEEQSGLALPSVDSTRLEAARARLRGSMFGKPTEPTSVGRFILLRRVGNGAMGVVYAAYDEKLDRKIAIKLIQHDRAKSAEAHKRLIREAKAMARLSHANVVHVYDAGEDRGQLFIAMEFVEGQTLRRWLKREQRDWREVLEIFAQIADGLAAAHESGVVHRDFKPDNVMVDVAGVPKVADFGLAGLEHTPVSQDSAPDSDSGPDDALTRTGTVIGSPNYMSSEQHRGQQASPQSDQFSYCVALWEALSGRRPFEGKTLSRLRESVETTRPTAPAGAPAPRWLFRILERGLLPDPDERWPSMQALLAELSRKRGRPRRMLPVVAAALVGVPIAALVAAEFASEDTIACDEIDAGGFANRHAPQFVRALENDGAIAKPLKVFRIRVDEYTERWTEQWVRVCIDQRTRSADPPTKTAPSACLDARRRDLDRLVTRVTQTPSLLTMSTTSIELPADPRDCERAVAGPALPSPKQAQAAAEIEETLREAWLAEVAGDHQGAQELAEQALTKAIEQGLEADRARSLLRIGVSQARLGAAEEAEASLRKAASIAEILGEDALVGEVFARMLGNSAELSLDPHVGQLLFQQALAKLERRDALGGEHEARLRGSGGSMYMRSGDAARARVEFEAAVELSTTVYGQADFRVADHKHNLAAALSELGRHEEAIQLAGSALEVLQTALGASHPRVADATLRLGNLVLRADGPADEALSRYRSAAAVYRALGDALPLEEANARVGIADALLRLGAPHDAVVSIEEAMAIYAEHSVPLYRLAHRQRAHHVAVVAYERVERWTEALEEVRAEQLLIPRIRGEQPTRAARVKLLEVRYLLELEREREASAVLLASEDRLRASGHGEAVERFKDYMRSTSDSDH